MRARFATSVVGWAKRFTAKRTISVNVVANDYRYGPLRSYWDGGSRDTWGLKTVVGGADAGEVENVTVNPFDGSRLGDTSTTTVLAPGTVLVRSGTFSGKPATLEITVRRDDVWCLFGIGWTAGIEEIQLRAACQAAEDKLPWGVYADWLDGQNRGEMAKIIRTLAGY